jgi:thiamine-phosphate pyrophosphorylase
MFRYAITSRTLFPGDDGQQQAAMVEQTARWGWAGVDFVQLREKDLPAAALTRLARAILKTLPASTKLLINSRPDIAIAAGAQGVHLTSSVGGLAPEQVRLLFSAASLPAPLISVSCHTLAEVQAARDAKVDAILFAPVFGKSVSGEIVSSGIGLEQLRAACVAAAPAPVFALGGVTVDNTATCLEAGAAGIAGIRLFHSE